MRICTTILRGLLTQSFTFSQWIKVPKTILGYQLHHDCEKYQCLRDVPCLHHYRPHWPYRFKSSGTWHCWIFKDHSNSKTSGITHPTLHHIWKKFPCNINPANEGLDGGTQTGLIWLRTATGGRLFWMQWWTFGFHKMWGMFWVAEDILASQEGLCSMELR